MLGFMKFLRGIAVFTAVVLGFVSFGGGAWASFKGSAFDQSPLSGPDGSSDAQDFTDTGDTSEEEELEATIKTNEFGLVPVIVTAIPHFFERYLSAILEIELPPPKA